MVDLRLPKNEIFLSYLQSEDYVILISYSLQEAIDYRNKEYLVNVQKLFVVIVLSSCRLFWAYPLLDNVVSLSWSFFGGNTLIYHVEQIASMYNCSSSYDSNCNWILKTDIQLGSSDCTKIATHP